MSDNLHLADDFERWMQLAEFYAKRHDERRSYEWKITLGLWAAVFGTMYTGFNLPRILFSYWLVALLFFTVFWLYGTWFRNKEDIVRQQFAERAATCTRDHGEFANELNPFLTQLNAREPSLMLEFIKNWARIFQFGATAAIMWLAWRGPLPPWKSVFLTLLVVIISFVAGMLVSSSRYWIRTASTLGNGNVSLSDIEIANKG